jgi:CHASE3 domain sensor protein
MNDWSAIKKLTAGFALAGVVLTANALVSYWNIWDLVDNGQRVIQTREIIDHLDDVFAVLRDAEAAQRGYLLTGEPENLESYRGQVRRLEEQLAALERTAADRPGQQARLTRLRGLVADRVDELNAGAVLRRESGVAAMVQLIAADRVKRTSERVRLAVQEMKAEEEVLLGRQMAARRASIARLYATFSVATALGLFGLGSGYFLIRRDVAARERSARRAAAQYAVARTLAESRTVGEAVPRLLEAVCRNTGWDAGTLWAADRDADVLRFVALWHDPSAILPQFEAASRGLGLGRGVGLAGRVWEEAQPVWLEDATDDEDFPHAADAARDGLRGAFAVPVLLGDEVLGVLEFFSRAARRPDPDLIEVMSAVGRQVGQFLERKRSESSLSRA